MKPEIESFIFLEKGRDSSSLERVLLWVELLDKASNEWQTINHRLACTHSLSISNALQIFQSICIDAFKKDVIDTSNNFKILSNCLLKLWLIALVLMEDDDDDVRASISSVVSDTFNITRLEDMLTTFSISDIDVSSSVVDFMLPKNIRVVQVNSIIILYITVFYLSSVYRRAY